MELTDELKSLLSNTAKRLKGSAQRLFLARTVKALGPGGRPLNEAGHGRGETHVQRLIGLERWFVDIPCATSASLAT